MSNTAKGGGVLKRRADKRRLKLQAGGEREVFVDLVRATIKEAGARSTPPADKKPAKPRRTGTAEPAAAAPEA
jgi:hypothetical protein